MIKYLGFVTILLSLLLVATTGFSAEVTLSWDASPTASVTGYKVYYQQNNPAPPLNGIGALEGVSPIDVGNVLTTTITGLQENTNYYFTLTAYDASGYESSYSNIVSSGWMPQLLVPADRAVNEPVPATFQWSTAPAGLDVRYTLFYGTDPELVAAVAPTSNNSDSHWYPLLIISLLSGLLLTLFRSLKTPKRGYAAAAAGLTLCLTLTSCGGGGGGDSSTPRGTENSPGTPATNVFAVDKGTSDYHQAFDLESGTTYYWKVVGIDVNDPAQTYTSSTFQFTTETF
jgi:hypothetical protein